MTNTTTDVPVTHPPAGPALTPGEALAKLFLDNADRGCNAENDALVVEILRRMRAVQALATPSGQ
ncbi:MAG: hypothetical protein ACRDRR_14650 [Pseudonocardiaceae bacterium]